MKNGLTPLLTRHPKSVPLEASVRIILQAVSYASGDTETQNKVSHQNSSLNERHALKNPTCPRLECLAAISGSSMHPSSSSSVIRFAQVNQSVSSSEGMWRMIHHRRWGHTLPTAWPSESHILLRSRSSPRPFKRPSFNVHRT